MILGIDEVGRGAWAGPLVVGAVVLGGRQIDGLTDSKKLASKKRRQLAKEIELQATAIGLGWVSAEIIDDIGLSEALRMAARLAVKEIVVPYDQIIIDGTIKLIDDQRATTLKQADLLVPSVSAASIIAKVARDDYMSQTLTQELPEYGFEKHVGYGTALHSQNLAKHGPSYVHRLSFAPVKKALGIEMTQKNPPYSEKIQTTTGRMAENLATDFLRKSGYEIIAQNWRTKLCEIDIVAKKGDTIYLVEVKYRKKSSYGDGLDAITPAKLRQMKFASRVWQHWHDYKNPDMRLGVIAMSGNSPQVLKWIDNVL